MARLYALQSFYNHRLGLVTLDDDVLSIVRQVREMYGDRVAIMLDENTGAYHFVEFCQDETERLIFTTINLDARALERLQRADSQSRGFVDSYDEAEREQDKAHEEIDRQAQESLREPLERLVHTLRVDGNEPLLPTPVPMYGPLRKRGRPSA